ncbi:flagellar assembly protein FliW [Cryobacterium sp. CG_9.6]|uniref:flagellar assembly protein FliW n=1 Tax=Cryobacterium sp. CG_9.6 TaxID=2760710 RepID=UPI0024752A1A|nr:flagellar assembly protein FliW [Cryobacterium sp. CG_9.6]MDH6237291.1 flagellar assembly factor FliW [Cryobacterium sp. CG_9.6]
MTATLTFVTPPPGLAPLTDFTLNMVEGANGLYSLQAVPNPSTRLYVLDAAVYLPEYTPYISAEQSGSLSITEPTDALVLVVVNPGEGTTTVNLMAPIVVNATTGVCAQLILEGQDWPLRAELSAA